MRMGKRLANWLAMGLFLLCAAGLVWLLGMETIPWQEPVRLAPVTVNGAQGVDSLAFYTGPLELEYTLPEQIGKLRPVLMIMGLNADTELLLDGAPFQRISKGLGRVYFTLPSDCAGSSLVLITEKRADEAAPSLFFMDDGIMEEQIRADTSLRAFPAAAFGAVFLLTLGLFLCGWLEGTRPWPVLPLCTAALGQAAYFWLRNMPLISLPPALYGLALWQSRALLFAAPPLYLMLRMEKRRRVFAPFAILPALVYWVTAGFQTVVPLFSNIVVYAGNVFWFTIPALLVCAVLEARDGSPAFRFVLAGLGACAAAAAALCAVFLARTGTLPPTLEMLLINPFFWIDTELFYWNALLLGLCFLESALAHIQRMTQRETDLQILSARESLMREQLATVQESAAALGELRHEVKNHYLVLQNLSRAGEEERLDAYLDGLISEAASIPALTCAPHPVINAVLTTMLARAQKQGVEVERRICIPQDLPFPDTELCSVLMNLLQNALDANALAPEGARKWMRVDIRLRGAHLYIGVENSRFAPVDYDDRNGLCRSTKEDKPLHGYGLKAVQAVARKYKSELVLNFPDGSFSAATALQMPD